MYEADLLETGGGIKNIEHRIGDETFIVYSGDILTDLPIDRLVEEHCSKDNDVTLALRTPGFQQGSIGAGKRAGWLTCSAHSVPARPGEFDFAGISVWNPSVFSRIPPATRISFIPIIIEWMRSGGKIGGMPLEESRWFNLGSRKEYLSAHRIIAQEGWVPDYLRGGSWPLRADPSARFHRRARSMGHLMWALGAAIERDVLLEDSILFPGSFDSSRHHAAILRRRRSPRLIPAFTWRPILYEP